MCMRFTKLPVQERYATKKLKNTHSLFKYTVLHLFLSKVLRSTFVYYSFSLTILISSALHKLYLYPIKRSAPSKIKNNEHTHIHNIFTPNYISDLRDLKFGLNCPVNILHKCEKMGVLGYCHYSFPTFSTWPRGLTESSFGLQNHPRPPLPTAQSDCSPAASPRSTGAYCTGMPGY